MKYLVACLILVLTLYKDVFAQESSSNFIVTNSGDTVRGSITPNIRSRNPDQINFGKTPGDVRAIYKPFRIREFRMEEEHYVSAVVPIERAIKTQNDPSSKSTWTKSQDTVFLQTIISGPKSVYMLITADGLKFFYILQDGHFELLTYRKTTITKADGTLAMSENKLYQGQLAAYLKGCASIESKVRKTTYEKRSLQLLFLDYYSCVGAPVKFNRSTAKEPLQWGIFAGVSSTAVKFDAPYSQLKADFKSTIAPTFGLFLNLGAPGKLDRISLYNEIMYKSYSITGDNRRDVSSGIYEVYHSEIAQSFVRVNNLLRYRIPVGTAWIALNAGISTQLIELSKTNKLTTERYVSGNLSTTTHNEAAPQGLIRMGTGYMVGATVTYNRWSLDFRYGKNPKVASLDNISSDSKSMYGLIGYRFSKN